MWKRSSLIRLVFAFAGLLGLFAVSAANPLGGLEQNWGTLVLVVLVIAIIYEVVVTLVEAGVYCMALRIKFSRALGISALANLASLIAGIWLGPGGPLGRFLVACIFEVPIVYLMMLKPIRQREPGFKIRVILSAIAANVVTHGLTLVFIHW